MRNGVMENCGVDLIMAKKKDTDMDQARVYFEKILQQGYKRSLWDRIKDGVGTFFLGCFILLCIAVVVFLIAMIIENPLSLAIICGTILIMWMWGNR